MSPSVVHAFSVILSLVVIEGLLSVDNALGIAVLARRLAPRDRRLALRLGFIGAYGFRLLALFFASWIMDNDWVKWLGAIYLIYLMCAELGEKGDSKDDDGEVALPAPFWLGVWKIALMDLSLSVDNVVTAVAFAPGQIWLVCTGVLIGIIALRYLAALCLRLLGRFPVLEKTAFLLVGYVGVLLMAELNWGLEVEAPGKFAGIVLLIFLSLLYGAKPALRRLCRPAFRAVQPVMRGFTWLVEAPFRLTISPLVRAVVAKVGKSG